MGKQPGEVSATEAAVLLRVATRETVYAYERRGLLVARTEPRGALGKVRRWYQREAVEALAAPRTDGEVRS